jgi:hypothetical protein
MKFEIWNCHKWKKNSRFESAKNRNKFPANKDKKYFFGGDVIERGRYKVSGQVRK